jgi:hypothetical protein
MNDCRSETALEPEQQEVDRRPVRMFNIKPLAPRTSAQAFAKAFDDDKRSVASGQSAKALSPAPFFDSATAKSAAEIGEAAGTGVYPAFDKCWDHWLAPSNPNAVKLSEHEHANVEQLCIVDRHNAAAAQHLGGLLEQVEGVESDDAKEVVLAVVAVMQCLDAADAATKNMLDDYGQKWFHTPEQFEINRLFGRGRDPELEVIAAGPGIFNVFKRQVNSYGQLAAYKSACSKLVPKAVAHTQPKTDWRAGSSAAKAKPKRQQPPQQMAAAAPARHNAGRGSGGGPRPPATAPVEAVADLP